jgi:hypothetical protein
MSELENVSMDDLEGVWNHIADNPLLMGIPLSERKGIDLLSALKDVYETNKKDQQSAQMLLTLLANVLVAAAQGDGEEVVEEVIVQEAMIALDKQITEVLNEGQ